MTFYTPQGRKVQIESIEALEAYLRKLQTADHDIYGVMLTLPDTYSEGLCRIWPVDNTQFSNMIGV